MTGPLHLLAIAAAVIVFALPVRACGQGEDQTGCGSPEPPKVETPRNPDSDNDPAQSFAQPAWMPCCIRDGAVLYHPPLGQMRERTRAYCAALDVAVIQACKTWRVK